MIEHNYSLKLEDVDYDVLICTGKSTQMVSNPNAKMPDKKYLNYEGQEFSEIEKGIMHESEKCTCLLCRKHPRPGWKNSEFIEGIE